MEKNVNITNQIKNNVTNCRDNLPNFVSTINIKFLNKMENNNKIYQFKTNINCGGCIATVTPFLNEIEGLSDWEVDTTNKDKILTVKTEETKEQQIIETVQKAGFKIELLNN
jgi:copper chaperone CopZ